MRHRIEPDAKSLYVQMDITTRCNLRCVMCAREQNLPEGRDMAVESFEMIARKVFDKAAVLNLSCGAEPLMSRHFEEILDVVKGYRQLRKELGGHRPLREICAHCPAVISKRVSRDVFC